MSYLAADLEPLAARRTLLFYDQRGAGRSTLVTDSTSLDAQRFAEDLEALRAHFGMPRLTLLGHSWGAGVAALYAARHPERVGRLLIVDAIPATRAQLRRRFRTSTRDETARRVDRFTMASLGEWDWRPGLRSVTAPALVILGSQDFMSLDSAREWAAALPNAHLLVLEGSGHFPYLDAPERFFAVVEEFLGGRWPAGGERR